MPRRPAATLGIALLVAALALIGLRAWQVAADSQQAERRAALIAGGDPQRGRELVQARGCGGCHHIPGVVAANGRVGPPLEGIAGRVYIAGVLENTGPNLVRWIEDPQAVDPRTAMPRTGTTGQDARDVAAFLLTLR